MVLIDFPRSTSQSKRLKAKNKVLAKKYGVKGYPTVLILDPQGKVVKRTGYQKGGPTAYVDMIKGVIAGK